MVQGKKSVVNGARADKKRADLANRVDFFGRREGPDEKEDKEDESDGEDREEISTPSQASLFRARLRTTVKGDDVPLPVSSFSHLARRFGLSPVLLRNLRRQQLREPTAVQAETLPAMMLGRDVAACAPTGSGKTLAYAVPAVQLLQKSKKKEKRVRCLVVVPTQELAQQVYGVFCGLVGGTSLCACVLDKSRASRFGPRGGRYDVMVATPLRLLGLVESGVVDLGGVELLVLDEADKLFEAGFAGQTDAVVEACGGSGEGVQKAMFSATMPSGVEAIAEGMMVSPVRVIVGRKEGASETIEQEVVYTGSEHGKLVAIRRMFGEGGFEPPAIVFVQSIQRAKALYHELVYDGVNVDVIHGERTSRQREVVIERFKEGKIWVLICTEVLGRGIDFRGVNLVLNYDVPESAQAYVHRIGRTGRAGRVGRAVTYYTKKDEGAIQAVVNVMRQSGSENVPEWMGKGLRKAGREERRRLKRRVADREEISTVPSIVKKKRREREEREEEKEKVKKEKVKVKKEKKKIDIYEE